MNDKRYSVKIIDTETNKEIYNGDTSIVFATLDCDDDSIMTIAGAHCPTLHIGEVIVGALEGLRKMAIKSSAGEYLFVTSLSKFMDNITGGNKDEN